MFFLAIPVAILAYIIATWLLPSDQLQRLGGNLAGLTPRRLGPGIGYFDAEGRCRLYRAPNGRLYAASSAMQMLAWANGVALPTGAEPATAGTGKKAKKRTFEERAKRGAAGASFGSVLGGAIGGALGLLLPPGNVVGAAAGASAGAAIGAGLGGGAGAAS